MALIIDPDKMWHHCLRVSFFVLILGMSHGWPLAIPWSSYSCPDALTGLPRSMFHKFTASRSDWAMYSLEKDLSHLDFIEELHGDSDDYDAKTCSADERAISEIEGSTVKLFDITDAHENLRADHALSLLDLNLSRTTCGKLFAAGRVFVANKGRDFQVVARKSHKFTSGDQVKVCVPYAEAPFTVKAEALPLSILFEDEHIIVINKKAGMVVHPAPGNWQGTVVNALAHYLNSSHFGRGDLFANETNHDSTFSSEELQLRFRPGIVHRLDKGTSGVLVVCKTSQALANLSSAFASRLVKKTYLAVVVGNPGRQVRIDKAIGRHPIHRQRMRVVPGPSSPAKTALLRTDITSDQQRRAGRNAVSHVDNLFFDGKLSLLKVRIETGRTHQIRVHLQDRGTPIYGDDIYGFGAWNMRLSKSHQINRPLLHAWKLEFDHPITSKRMVFSAPLPDDMASIAASIWPDGKADRPEIFLDTRGDLKSAEL